MTFRSVTATSQYKFGWWHLKKLPGCCYYGISNNLAKQGEATGFNYGLFCAKKGERLVWKRFWDGIKSFFNKKVQSRVYDKRWTCACGGKKYSERPSSCALFEDDFPTFQGIQNVLFVFFKVEAALVAYINEECHVFRQNCSFGKSDHISAPGRELQPWIEQRYSLSYWKCRVCFHWILSLDFFQLKEENKLSDRNPTRVNESLEMPRLSLVRLVNNFSFLQTRRKQDDHCVFGLNTDRELRSLRSMTTSFQAISFHPLVTSFHHIVTWFQV